MKSFTRLLEKIIPIAALIVFIIVIAIILALSTGCAVGSGAKVRDYTLNVQMTSGEIPEWPRNFQWYEPEIETLPEWEFKDYFGDTPLPPVKDVEIPLDDRLINCYQCVIINVNANVPKTITPTLSTPLVGREKREKE